MSIPYNKVNIIIHLDTIRENYQKIKNLAKSPIPVIKSDAYGHGLIEVGHALSKEGADILAVGSMEEGVALRESGFGGKIIALLGAHTPEEAALTKVHRIMPFVSTLEQLALIAKHGSEAEPLDIALKFDTGMRRLGFAEEEMRSLLSTLDSMPQLKVALACSHFASADVPLLDAYTRQQADIFMRCFAGLQSRGHNVKGSLVNSAGLLAYPDMHLDYQRPGIALYGANPFAGTHFDSLGKGLTAAMEVSIPIIQTRDVPIGMPISYGCTYTTNRPMRIAVVAAGYADAFTRRMSNTGYMTVHGKRCRIVGSVCMQMIMLDITDVPNVQPGDFAWSMGGPGDEPVTPEELAQWCGTITYEVFCLRGMNERTYVSG